MNLSSRPGADAVRKQNIFLSYRKKDTESTTGRLFDTLKTHFSNDQIFMDMDKLEPGVDFEEVINRRLDDCDIMLAIIGPDWLGQNADGTTRIRNEDDWVRMEIGKSLKRKIRVIPVLVEGGKMPSADQLPEDLHPLAGKQAHEVTNTRWAYDTNRLVETLQHIMGVVPAEAKPLPSSFAKTAKGGLQKLVWVFAALGVITVFLVWDPFNLLEEPADKALVENANTKEGTSADSNTSEEGAVPAGDVHAIWYEADNENDSTYYEFNQRDTTFDVKKVVDGVEEASGSGTVNGTNISFMLTIEDVEKTTTAELSEGGKKLTGATTYTLNGIDKTDDFILNRKNE